MKKVVVGRILQTKRLRWAQLLRAEHRARIEGFINSGINEGLCSSSVVSVRPKPPMNKGISYATVFIMLNRYDYCQRGNFLAGGLYYGTVLFR